MKKKLIFFPFLLRFIENSLILVLIKSLTLSKFLHISNLCDQDILTTAPILDQGWMCLHLNIFQIWFNFYLFLWKWPLHLDQHSMCPHLNVWFISFYLFFTPFLFNFLDTHVSLAPTNVRCPSVRRSVTLSDLHSVSVSGRPTWKVEESGPQLFFQF